MTVKTSLKTRSVAAAAALLLLGAPLLAGCFQGQRASTTMQAQQPTGNGTYVTVGSVQVQNATIVKDEASSTAAMLVSLFNNGNEDDALVAVEVAGVPATVNPQGQLIPKGGLNGVNYGFDGTNTIALTTDAKVSTFVPVLMQFRNAGVVEFEALVVPKAGYYADVK